jgi:hypothetical protein
MTDLDIHVPESPAPPAIPDLDQLRDAIRHADATRQTLADAADWVTLAWGLDRLKTITAELRDLAKAIEADVANLLPGKQTVPGLGTIELRHSTIRRNWDSTGLAKSLAARALVDPATGEMTSGTATEAAEAVLTELAACAPFTGSMGWRVGALRDRGYEVDEWCEVDGNRTSEQIRGNK